MPIKLKSREYDGLRKRCIELLREGHIPQRVSEMLGCTSSWVSKTQKRFKLGGEEALKTRKPGGNTPRISESDVKVLLLELEKGVLAHGFTGEIWNQKRVGAIIFKLFGQKYDPSHIGRILKKAGWTLQKPQVKARQQKAEAVENWRQEKLPALKKKPNQKTG